MRIALVGKYMGLQDAYLSVSEALRRVVIPAGEWGTGAIHLKSGVNLHVSKGATLKFSTKPADYPVVFTRWEGIECMSYSSLIYAIDQKNIAVTGEGTLDGQAAWDTWWAWNAKDKTKPIPPQKPGPFRQGIASSGWWNQCAGRRARFWRRVASAAEVHPALRCKNILIEDVTLVRSPMWELHPVLCQQHQRARSEDHYHGPNNDGCDPEMSKDVLIEDCLFDTGDDCIAIKSGRNNDGRRIDCRAKISSFANAR